MNDQVRAEVCAICEKPTTDAHDGLIDDKPVRVCRGCFEYETGEKPENARNG